MDEEYVKISQLPQIEKENVSDEDLILLSHASGINDSNGNTVYTSNKLQVGDLKKIAQGQIEEIAPDGDTIGFNSLSALEVQKVYIGNIIGLGELATMNKADLGLGDLAEYDIWTGTQADYDRITTKNPKTLYFIK